jgi:hypothetical protein
MSFLKKIFAKDARPSSTHILYAEAEPIVGEFGLLVAELNDPKEAPFLRYLPKQRLGCSKDRVQMALAVAIAEWAYQCAVGQVGQNRAMIDAATFSSGDLVRFSASADSEKVSSAHWKVLTDSQELYQGWAAWCEKVIRHIREQTRVNALRQCTGYWLIVDQELVEFLKEPSLVAICSS